MLTQLYIRSVLACLPSIYGSTAMAEAQPEVAASSQTGRSALTDQLELPRLIDLCSQRLKLTIEYDPQALTGKITLRQGDPIDDAELWSLTNRLLVSRGFTTIRAPGGGSSLSVVKLTDAAAQSRTVTLDTAAFPADFGPYPPGFAAVAIRIVNRPSREIAESLKLVLGKTTGTVTEMAGSTTSVGGATSSGGVVGGNAGGAGASSVGGGSGSGYLLIADVTPRVEQALALIARLDTPAERVVVEEYALRFLTAAQVTSLVTQVTAKQASLSGRKSVGEVIPSPTGNLVLIVAPDGQLTSWRSLLEQIDAREPVETLNYSPRYFSIRDVAKLIDQTIKAGTGSGGNPADDRLRVITDELTGTLIITATPSQHERIAALMARLEAAPSSVRRPTRTFIVKNRPVKEMVEVLNRLMQSGAIDAAAGTAELRPAGAAGSSPSGDAANDLAGPTTAAAAVPPSNPVGGTAPSLTRVSDAPRPVLPGVNAPAQRTDRALSLTADDATNTLIAIGDPRALDQLESVLLSLDVRQPQVMLEVLLVNLTDSKTLALGIELERLAQSGDVQLRLSSLFGISTTNASSTTTVPGGTGGTVTVLSPGDFSIVIRALETINQGRSLSVPRILVGNNQKGEFNAVTQQPVATTVTPSSQVTTTSFGGYEPAGTTVSVQPQIAEGDHLTLMYNVTLSSFSGAATNGLPPPRQENRLQSQVTIPDGYTVAVGGIELTTDSEGTTQVPLLGSIPIVGEAFKNRSNSQARSRFFVFIRAEVMRRDGFEDLKYVSDRAVGAAEIDDGFPVVEPMLVR